MEKQRKLIFLKPEILYLFRLQALVLMQKLLKRRAGKIKKDLEDLAIYYRLLMLHLRKLLVLGWSLLMEGSLRVHLF